MTLPAVALTLDDATLERLGKIMAALLGDRPGARTSSPWMASDAAAAYLGISIDGLHRLTSRRAIPCHDMRGRWVFHREELDRWVLSDCPGPADRTFPQCFLSRATPDLMRDLK